ncbi:flagellar biosynthesis protein FlhF [Tenuibacillus multivorans]|uniref:Flagellar biosynthesis protein FlhF n=1 Tax=Tenuibacillus multivorans TaxID=237069 RepID=A0A1G9XZ60_9BACI|nr:flagellar biosynthesis protein FlhF [Tenuibacillus multivorans]GEL75860.1 flagellar biosynthesis protein FlhF [Tenuibacillus multivorans]SDN01523.1 flagellar biosynthesis protein FlhF [Tenuibacillus multivorans]
MKVKKYTAPTMPEAMKVVRQDLGQSAVILNSREQRTRGFLGLFRKKYIEVFAAVDPNPGIEPQTNRIKRPIKETFEVRQPVNNARESNDDILKEIKALKTQLNQQETKKTMLPLPIQNIHSQLENQELNHSVINEVVPILLEQYYSKHNDDPQSLMTYVKHYFLTKLKDDNAFSKHDSKARWIYLLGATGVGKTTTIAKLAASSSIASGKRIAFITLDTYRIAAIDQLKTYAKILNVPVEVAYNLQDFEKAKEKFKDYDIVFIDSAGRNYLKDEYINRIQDFVTFGENEEIYCVLSLTSKQKDLDQIFQRFSKLNIDRVIFTKADETSQFGTIYNLWKKYKFKISYITFGQSVPDDIQEATPELIADLIVGEKEW